MDWTSKSGEEIEAELVVRMRESLALYQGLKAVWVQLMDLWHGIEEGTPDGMTVGRRVFDCESALGKALAEYRLSVRRFTDFVVLGRIPSD